MISRPRPSDMPSCGAGALRTGLIQRGAQSQLRATWGHTQVNISAKACKGRRIQCLVALRPLCRPGPVPRSRYGSKRSGLLQSKTCIMTCKPKDIMAKMQLSTWPRQKTKHETQSRGSTRWHNATLHALLNKLQAGVLSSKAPARLRSGPGVSAPWLLPFLPFLVSCRFLVACAAANAMLPTAAPRCSWPPPQGRCTNSVCACHISY